MSASLTPIYGEAAPKSRTRDLPLMGEGTCHRTKCDLFDLFIQWRKKKIAERDAGLAAQMAERAKNDRMSGRELFLSDSSLFVDDAEAHGNYQREQEPAVSKKKANENSNGHGPSDSATAGGDAEVTNVDDDDELDIDELNELEASLTKVTIQEPGARA
ncbi:hypothetical protein ACFX1Q_010269 [Malus domestica]